VTIPSGNYPKMATAQTTKTVPLVYPPGHVKQGTFVIFNNTVDENAYDGTGIAMSTATGIHENRHHS
jgi:hypothetical protein